MTTKKNTRGGTRQGSGAKPKYKEQTKTVLRKREYDSKLYQLTLKLSKMKKQLSTLTAGTKFYFGNNVNIVCEVTFNSGKTMRIRQVGKKTQTRYNKMPSICEGHSVTIC